MNKKQLYEKIMQKVSKEVKSALNEANKKIYNELNSDLKKSFYKSHYSKETGEDSWGEPITIGCYIFGNFKPIPGMDEHLMVGCVKTIENNIITAVLGDGSTGILNVEKGFKRLSTEMLRQLFDFDRLVYHKK